MGYGSFSFFVYIKSTSQYYIVCKRSKISFSIYFGGFFSSSSHASHVFNGKPRSLATSSGERLVFILASLIVIKICFSYKNGIRVKKYFAPLTPDCFVLCTLAIFKNIHNSLIFLRKMAAYSCFWRVPRTEILLQASLHRIFVLLTLVSSYHISTLFSLLFSEN